MALTPTTASVAGTTEPTPGTSVKAVRLHGPADLSVGEESAPVAGPGEELVRVVAVGLCGSDRHWFMEGGIGDAVISRPLVLGHEIAGVIETGPRKGQPVVVDPAIPCGSCDLCQRDLGYLCRDVRFAGHGITDGGLRQLMAWPRAQLEPLPESIDISAAALLEPLAVALHAVDLGQVGPGMRAGVFGCGPIGLMLVEALRRLGVESIVATDPLAHRREAARSLGAGEVRMPGRTLTGRVDVAFEVSGEDDGARRRDQRDRATWPSSCS